MRKHQYVQPKILLKSIFDNCHLMAGSGPSGNDNPTPGVGGSSSSSNEAKSYRYSNIWDNQEDVVDE